MEYGFVAFDSLTILIRRILQCYGVGEDAAAISARILSTADAWGIRSHGVARLRAYCEMLSSGRINKSPRFKLLANTPSLALVDGDNGLGFAVADFSNKMAGEKALESGSAWVSVRNSNHFGIAGYYAFESASRGLIGLALTNTPAIVAPFGGKGRMLGSNPIAAAFPTLSEWPVLMDFATSVVSLGTVENSIREDRQLPEGCLLNAEGNISREPGAFFRGGALLPLGGGFETGGHKGYCLSAFVDLLCGPMGGAAFGPFVPSFLSAASQTGENVGEGIGHTFGAISTDAFRDVVDIRDRIDTWVQTMRLAEPRNDTERVLVPGDPEREASIQSRIHGVKLDQSVLDDVIRLGEDVGVRLVI